MYRNISGSKFCRNSGTSNKPHRTVLNNGGCIQGISCDTATNFQLEVVLHIEKFVAEYSVYVIFKSVNKIVPHNT